MINDIRANKKASYTHKSASWQKHWIEYSNLNEQKKNEKSPKTYQFKWVEVVHLTKYVCQE